MIWLQHTLLFVQQTNNIPYVLYVYLSYAQQKVLKVFKCYTFLSCSLFIFYEVRIYVLNVDVVYTSETFMNARARFCSSNPYFVSAFSYLTQFCLGWRELTHAVNVDDLITDYPESSWYMYLVKYFLFTIDFLCKNWRKINNINGGSWGVDKKIKH